jgi:cobalt-zinc-cadmium efflux system protein
MSNSHSHSHDELSVRQLHQKKTTIVILISFIVMIVEIVFGYTTGSMSLLGDGFHMSTHVFAIGLSWLAYRLVEKFKDDKKLKHGTSKFLPLAGYTSAFFLIFVVIFMIKEAFERLVSPEIISFNEAIIVAVIGLVVNLVCAVILHSDHLEHDHNIKGAYLHVLSDAVTSVMAIIALLCAKYYNVVWLDPIMAIISSVIIFKWAYSLIIKSAKKLIDYEEEHAHDHQHDHSHDHKH